MGDDGNGRATIREVHALLQQVDDKIDSLNVKLAHHVAAPYHAVTGLRLEEQGRALDSLKTRITFAAGGVAVLVTAANLVTRLL